MSSRKIKVFFYLFLPTIFSMASIQLILYDALIVALDGQWRAASDESWRMKQWASESIPFPCRSSRLWWREETSFGDPSSAPGQTEMAGGRFLLHYLEIKVSGESDGWGASQRVSGLRSEIRGGKYPESALQMTLWYVTQIDYIVEERRVRSYYEWQLI